MAKVRMIRFDSAVFSIPVRSFAPSVARTRMGDTLRTGRRQSAVDGNRENTHEDGVGLTPSGPICEPLRRRRLRRPKELSIVQEKRKLDCLGTSPLSQYGRSVFRQAAGVTAGPRVAARLNPLAGTDSA